MRTYGKDSNGTWVVVETDPSGDNSAVYITTLAQCLKLSPGESPFFADYGIPAQQSVVTQVYPDFYVAKIQAQFAQYFGSLSISRLPSPDGITPSYRVDIVTKNGDVLSRNIAV